MLGQHARIRVTLCGGTNPHRVVYPSQLDPRALEAFDGPYDLWEEAAKESLELLLDADNHPMILLDRFVVNYCQSHRLCEPR